MTYPVNVSWKREKGDDPRSRVTSKRATAGDLEIALASTVCVSSAGGK